MDKALGSTDIDPQCETNADIEIEHVYPDLQILQVNCILRLADNRGHHDADGPDDGV